MATTKIVFNATTAKKKLTLDLRKISALDMTADDLVDAIGRSRGSRCLSTRRSVDTSTRAPSRSRARRPHVDHVVGIYVDRLRIKLLESGLRWRNLGQLD